VTLVAVRVAVKMGETLYGLCTASKEIQRFVFALAISSRMRVACSDGSNTSTGLDSHPKHHQYGLYDTGVSIGGNTF
jgi:hypothetical protein